MGIEGEGQQDQGNRGLDRFVREQQRGAQLDINVLQAGAGTESAKKSDSYLDIVANHTVKPVLNTFLSDRRAEEYTGLVKQFGKMTPLFMKGKTSFLTMGALFAADEAKHGDSAGAQIFDGLLGVGKAGSLKGSFLLAQHFKHTPSMIGLELGIINRSSDSLLTRNNYKDKNGEYSATTGLLNAAATTFRPEMLLMDAVSFGAADLVWGRMFSRSRGTAYYNPLITHSMTGATIGIASGGGHELLRQVSAREFDPVRFAEKTFAEGAFGAASGYIGGRQALNFSRIDYSTKNGLNTQEPRLSPFVDEHQIALRDGTFTFNHKNTNLTTEAWVGKVTGADGTVTPAIFRPIMSAPGYAERMLAEVSGYGFGKLTGIGDSIPVSVARTVEVGGKTYSGYIQRMEGVDLRAYLSEQAKTMFGSDTPQNMLRAFRADTQLQQSFANSMGEKMIFGEWDNHALNQLVVAGNGPKVTKIIDLQDSLKPAKYTWDQVPDPGFLRGWEGLNSLLYKDLQGKVAPQPLRENAQRLVDVYDNPIGRQQLQEQTGWSYQQVEGVLARSRYFAENGVFPHAQKTSITYPLLGIIKRGLMTGTFKTQDQLGIRRISGE